MVESVGAGWARLKVATTPFDESLAEYEGTIWASTKLVGTLRLTEPFVGITAVRFAVAAERALELK